MWDLPGPGLEPVSPALAGRFLTTAPPGKSDLWCFNMIYSSSHLPNSSRIETKNLTIIGAMKISSVVTTGGGRMVWNLQKSLILRELSLFNMSDSFLETPTHRACLSLTWFRACSVQAAFSPGHLLKTIGAIIWNLSCLSWKNNWGKQKADQTLQSKS